MKQKDQLELLIGTLDRQTVCDSLGALMSALRPEKSPISMLETAVGLDANVFLRLASHKKNVDIIDYFGSRHSAPLVLPGQAIQEFWNNQLQAVETVSASLRKHFAPLKDSLQKVNDDFGGIIDQVDTLLSQFASEHGHVYSEANIRKTLSLLEVLSKKALVSYAPRAPFHQVCELRKRTKTPPGFRDDGDGDFYIWVDFLLGLLQARSDGKEFKRVALVSVDKKVDWSRSGIAHPVLAAEVQTLFNVSFEIWSIDRLADEISAVIAVEHA